MKKGSRKRRRVISLLLIFALITILPTATTCSEAGKVSLGEEVSLNIGQSASIEGEELQIRFIEVAGDSRCPRGVTCIWAGEVKCIVEITYSGSLQRVTLTEPGLTSWPPAESFKQYQIAFHVEPYPKAGIDIAPDEYRLLLKVTK
jgi:hypothetical protein